MAGSGSQHTDPTRRGSPASDARGHVDTERPGASAPTGRDGGDHDATGHPSSSGLAAFLRRFDDGFSRTFMAMAMAEDGTRELALEQLEGQPGPVDDTPSEAEAPGAPKGSESEGSAS